VLTWGVVGAALGLAVALSPFWIDLRVGLPPKGPTCGLEDQSGAGSSRLGVERVEWSLTPAVRCVARGTSTSVAFGPNDVNLALYRDLWPFAAVALVPVAWAVIFLVGLVLRDDG
jgi:hypothetical protein